MGKDHHMVLLLRLLQFEQLQVEATRVHALQLKKPLTD